MIRHIVMWTIKDEFEGKNKLELSLIIKEKLESLQPEIHGLVSITVGIDTHVIDNNYDVVLIFDFIDTDALDAYQVHPLHKEAGVFIKSVATGRCCVDYKL